MADPEIEREEALAIRELARRLRPWASAMQDHEAFAGDFIAALRAHGWRPPLGPPPDRGRRPDPDTAAKRAHRGAELARELLAATREDDDP